MIDVEGIMNFLVYLGSSIGLLLAGAISFMASTKISEWNLIKSGNVSASMTLGGKLFGLAIIIYAAITYSVSIPDLIMWGAIGIVALIIAYHLFEIVTPRFNVQEAIANDNRAVGALVFFILVSLGAVIGACLSY